MHSYFYFANTRMHKQIYLFAKQKIMGKNALAFLVLFVALRQIVSRFPYEICACISGLGAHF